MHGIFLEYAAWPTITLTNVRALRRVVSPFRRLLGSQNIPFEKRVSGDPPGGRQPSTTAMARLLQGTLH